MGDFISHTLKLVVIYFVFYWLGVFVFGGAACLGCVSIIKAGGEWAQEEQARELRAAASSPGPVPTKPAPSAVSKKVKK